MAGFRWAGLVLTAALIMPSAQAYQPAAEERQLASIALTEMPEEGRETMRLIKQGGPFPYARDGVVFSNFERVLPRRQRGYYREYTVKTPGIRHRGARRIVCGVVPECYYTADHYQTFKRIRESR